MSVCQGPRLTGILPAKHGVCMSKRAESFRDLEIYQEVCALDLEIFQLTKSWPKEEMYALTDQVRRSSRSIGANISEAWAKRRYPAHFTSKLTDADGELQETQHWLLRAHAYSYMPKAHLDTLMERALRIGRRLGRMMQFDNW